jgi:hypothetical protein
MSKPPANRPPSAVQIERARMVNEEYKLFFDNLDLILANEMVILSCDQYFFCRPEFSNFAQYITRPVALGALLLGWRHGILRERCCRNTERQGNRQQDGSAYIYFGGGPASHIWWRAYCPTCRRSTRHDGYEQFKMKDRFCVAAAQQAKDWTDELVVVRYHSAKFSWGEPAVVPTVSTKVVKRRTLLVEAVTVKQLIEALTARSIRPPTPRDRSLVLERVTWTNSDGQVETLDVLI